MKQEHINMKHALVEKKNFIVNYVVIKSHVKAHKEVKNMMKKSSNKKKSVSLLNKKKVILLT